MGGGLGECGGGSGARAQSGFPDDFLNFPFQILIKPADRGNVE